MTITPEELAAFADGELTGADKERVAAAIARDESLARQLEAHRALKARLAGHFAPVLEQPIPDRLTQMLTNNTKDEPGAANVIDFAVAREERAAKRRLPAWGWGGAVAASIAAVVMFSTYSAERDPGYASTQIAQMLDAQTIAEQPAGSDKRVLLSFRNRDGEFCRAYNAAGEGGIACRDAKGWRLEAIGKGEAGGKAQYRMAGGDVEILEIAQEMAVGEALDGEGEIAARKAGWRAK